MLDRIEQLIDKYDKLCISLNKDISDLKDSKEAQEYLKGRKTQVEYMLSDLIALKKETK